MASNQFKTSMLLLGTLASCFDGFLCRYAVNTLHHNVAANTRTPELPFELEGGY